MFCRNIYQLFLTTIFLLSLSVSIIHATPVNMAMAQTSLIGNNEKDNKQNNIDFVSPINVILTAVANTDETIQITAQVSSNITFDQVQLTLNTTPEIDIISSNMPTNDHLESQKPKTYNLLIQVKQNTSMSSILLYVSSHEAEVGASSVLYINRSDKGTTILNNDTVYDKINKEQKKNAKSNMEPDNTINEAKIQKQLDQPSIAQPSSVPGQVSIYARFSYYDHIPSTTSISSTPTPRLLRKAYAYVEKSTFSNPIIVASTFTDNGGAMRLLVDKSSFGGGGAVLRVGVCTRGAAGSTVSVGNSTGNYWCYVSPWTEYEVIPASINYGDIFTPDTDQGSGPFNIYDVALESYEYQTRKVANPNRIVAIQWYPGLSGSSYNEVTNLIYISGGGNGNADQWDDAAIAHEFGHWVMYQNVGYPPNVGVAHGSCNLSLSYPNVGWAEGWATFFSSAARSESLYAETRRDANFYVDFADDGVPGIGTSKQLLFRDLENVADLDPGLPAFRQGNFCEWRVAAALWDIIDSSPVSEPVPETIQEPYNDVFTAMLTKYNGHYPYTINDWWYGWTNTIGGRSGTSLGSEQQIFNMLGGQKIQVGMRFDLSWGTTPPDLDAHLWLPPGTHQFHVYLQQGTATAPPWSFVPADIVSGSGPELMWIVSPYAGAYVYAAFDYSNCNDSAGIASSNARVIFYNGSAPIPISVTMPSTGAGDWWDVARLQGETSLVTIINRVQTTPPGAYDATGYCGIPTATRK